MSMNFFLLNDGILLIEKFNFFNLLILQSFNKDCGEYRPDYSGEPMTLIIFFQLSCGEYRSRTDDLLRARQAL